MKREIKKEKYFINLILGSPHQELCSNQCHKQHLCTEIDFLLGFFFLSMEKKSYYCHIQWNQLCSKYRYVTASWVTYVGSMCRPYVLCRVSGCRQGNTLDGWVAGMTKCISTKKLIWRIAYIWGKFTTHLKYLWHNFCPQPWLISDPGNGFVQNQTWAKKLLFWLLVLYTFVFAHTQRNV